MKIVTGETMQQMDRRAMEEFGVPGLVLMENAGRACVDAIMSRYGGEVGGTAVIVAGKGNNGGDGYVIARLLKDRGWRIWVIVIASRDEITGDAAANLARLDAATVTFCPEGAGLENCSGALKECALLVDALLGTGLRSDVKGPYATTIDVMNRASAPVFSVDIPSGVHANNGKILGAAVRADMTVTFAVAKLGNVLFPGAVNNGLLQVADIGIPEQVLAEAPGYEYFDGKSARKLLKKRSRMAHKGACGHCLVIAGSSGKSGAAAMAANSAVRGGAGLVSVAVPATINPIMELKTTEAMSIPLPDGDNGYLGSGSWDPLITALSGKDAVALGPGLGGHPETRDLVRRLLGEISVPLVIDADGLNALAEDTSVLLRRRSTHVIVTPHPGEMSRLAACSIDQVEDDRLHTASGYSRKYGVHLLLKGARTIVAAPDGSISINSSGNPGMASGGMGDVLTGLITALLCQGYAPFDACRIGAYLHGYAADLVAADKGEIGMSAVDVQEQLPYAFRDHMK